jgi:uncharacterized membrane protein YeaQ/YmgE (transglycosylase-associated protein family)
MGIIAWVILGLLAGLIARAVLPGNDHVGVIATLVIGIAGALIGGFISELLGFEGLGTFFEIRTWIIAVAGSMLLLLLVRAVANNGRHRRPLSSS